MVLAALALALATGAPAATAAATSSTPGFQGGFTSEKHPRYGLKLVRPRDYDPIPVQPSEDWVVLQWAERPEEREPRRRQSIQPVVRIVWIDWVPDPEPDPEPRAEPSERDGGSTATSYLEAEEVLPPINSLERYVDQELPEWKLGGAGEEEQSSGYTRTEYRLDPARPTDPRAGWVTAWRNQERTIVLFGVCADAEFDKEVRVWRQMASRMKLGKPVPPNTAKWDRYYARRPKFKDPAFRTRARLGLVKGWDVLDTENFIVLYSTSRERLVQLLAQKLEAIRASYVELFPPAKEVEVVSAVRICRDKQEYIMYGGSPWSGGYWNAAGEELVFFEYEDEAGDRNSGEEDAEIVLYHEAFHQFIYYSVGRVAPHSWFNEGHGDFFSGAVFDRFGEVVRIGVNPWRAAYLKFIVERGQHIPFKDILGFEQSEFYAPRRRSICYAQAWSMIYFLRTSKLVARREDWSRILTSYFDTLKAANAKELAQLEKSRLLEDEEQLEQAQKRARDQALEAAFEGIDLWELEQAWLDFVDDLELPK